MKYIEETTSLDWMDNIMMDVISHPDISETFHSLENSTLEYLLKCWEKIRIDRFVEKDLRKQEASRAKAQQGMPR